MIGLAISLLWYLGLYGLVGFLVASMHVHCRSVIHQDRPPVGTSHFRELVLVWPIGVFFWLLDAIKLSARGGGHLIEAWLRWIQFVPRWQNLDGSHVGDKPTSVLLSGPPPWEVVGTTSEDRTQRTLPPPPPSVKIHHGIFSSRETAASVKATKDWKKRVARMPKEHRTCSCGYGIEPTRLWQGKRTCATCQRKQDAKMLGRLVRPSDVCKCGNYIEAERLKRTSMTPQTPTTCGKCAEEALDEILRELEAA
jgi:hypothetical protein